MARKAKPVKAKPIHDVYSRTRRIVRPDSKFVIRMYSEFIVSIKKGALYCGIEWTHNQDIGGAKKWDSEKEARDEVLEYFHGAAFPSLFHIEPV